MEGYWTEIQAIHMAWAQTTLPPNNGLQADAPPAARV
jgi:hypothetical protein